MPTTFDISIAGALLAGQTTPTQIAAYIKCGEGRVARYLENPVAMRWISDTVSSHIGSRLGIVSAAIFSRAAQGDVAAAKLLFEKYDAIVHRSQHSVLHLKGPDLSGMSNEDLELLLKDKARQLGEKEVLEADFVIKGDGNDEERTSEESSPEMAREEQRKDQTTE